MNSENFNQRIFFAYFYKSLYYNDCIFLLNILIGVHNALTLYIYTEYTNVIERKPNMSAVVSEKRRVGNPEWNFVLPYDEARRIVKQHRFKSMKQYVEWVKEEKPHGLSLNPYQVYTRRGEWINTAHYLGKIDDIIPEDKGVDELPPVKFGKIGRIIAQIFNLRH